MRQEPAVAEGMERLEAGPAAEWAVFVWSACDGEALLDKLDQAIADAQRVSFGELFDACASRGHTLSSRLAFCARDGGDLSTKLAQARQRIERNRERAFATPTGIFYDPDLGERGKVAWLFPGQGSQYRGMLDEIIASDARTGARFFELDRRFVELGLDAPGASVWGSQSDGASVALQSHDTFALQSLGGGGQVALNAGLAFADLAARLQIPCDGMLGHSNGEMTALMCSRTMRLSEGDSPEDVFLRISKAFSRVDGGGEGVAGSTAAITATDRPAVDRVLGAWTGRIHVMLDNCPQQLVVFGGDEDIAQVSDELQATGALVLPLPFGRAYHTPLMTDFAAMFMSFYEACEFGEGSVPLYSACSVGRFPGDSAGIGELANAQWLKTVRFGDTITQMHSDGYRVFVEVGAGGRLTGFVRASLKGLAHVGVALDKEGRSGRQQLSTALAQLFVAGVDVDLSRLPWREGVARKPSSDGELLPVRDSLAHQNSLLMQSFLETEEWLSGEVFSALRSIGAGDADVSGSSDAGVGVGYASDTSWPEFLELAYDGEEFVSANVVLRASDRHMADHAFARTPSKHQDELRGLPVLPFCMSIEIAERMALKLAPEGMVVCRLSGARGHRWIGLDHGETTLAVEARIISAGEDGRRRVHVTLFELSRDEPATLNKAFEVTAVIDTAYCAEGRALEIAKPDVPGSVKRTLDEYVETLLFHGPTYKLLDGLTGLDPMSVSAWMNCPQMVRGSQGRAVCGPMLDIPGQLLAYWGSEFSDDIFTAFPIGIGSIDFFGPVPTGGSRIHVVGRINSTGDILTASFLASDEHGRPVFAVNDLRAKYDRVPVNIYHALFWREERKPFVRPVRVGQHVVWVLDGFCDEFLEAGNEIWKRSLVHATHCQAEINRWNQLPERGVRRLERLLGAVCVKEAVRLFVLEGEGVELDLSDVSVEHDWRGRPCVRQIAGPKVMQLPGVSIAHSNGNVCAMLSPVGASAGVDIECLARGPMMDDWLAIAFSDDEIAVLAAAGLGGKRRLGFMAKEAASKAIGTGLLGEPRRWKIVDATALSVSVEIMGFVVGVDICDDGGVGLAACVVDKERANEIAERLMPMAAVG